MPLYDTDIWGGISGTLADQTDLQSALDAKVSFPGFTSLAADYSFTDNSGDWNTAFGWGNHASAGYLTSVAPFVLSTNLVEQRNGTNAQAHRWYNTWSSSGANYERFTVDWQATPGTCKIGMEFGGTGTAKPIEAIGVWTFKEAVTVATSVSGVGQDLFLIKDSTSTTQFKAGITSAALGYMIIGNAGYSSASGAFIVDNGNANAAIFSRSGSTRQIIMDFGSNVPKVRIANSTAIYSIGVTAGDVFTICDGSTLGTNDRLTIDGTGNATIPGNTGMGTAVTATSILSLGASTTAKSSINIPAGVEPTSPVNDDMWFVGDVMYRRIAGVTKSVTFT